MAVHIIIDGYNLIRQSNRLGDLDRQELQLGREALIDTLVAYRQKAFHRITVVFDGARAPDFICHPEPNRGIEITYSSRGESADTVIKRLAALKREEALVVSSDLDIVQFVSSRGAATISSPEFEAKIAETLYNDPTLSPGEDETGWVPTTRKKGPHRRQPKKVRRNLKKIAKL